MKNVQLSASASSSSPLLNPHQPSSHSLDPDLNPKASQLSTVLLHHLPIDAAARLTVAIKHLRDSLPVTRTKELAAILKKRAEITSFIKRPLQMLQEQSRNTRQKEIAIGLRKDSGSTSSGSYQTEERRLKNTILESSSPKEALMKLQIEMDSLSSRNALANHYLQTRTDLSRMLIDCSRKP